MIGTLIQNRYRLDAELGRGGMGIVYRAHDTLLDRNVAVKVLHDTGLGSEGRARLLREAQAAAKLDHPNIVTVYDAGEADGIPFIVMQLVEGNSLHEHPATDLNAIIAVAQQLCAALEHAHAHGIVHRDLKPENVIVTPDGSIKLMDFGLARAAASRITAEGGLVGTVFYLAPEQVLGQPVDGRADLYALGIMLYELTAGRLPFVADDPLAVISQHLYAPPVPPGTYNSAIPLALEAIILKLLSKNPVDRFASAQEVARALEDASAGTPLAARESVGGVVLLNQLARGRLVGRQGEVAQLRELWAQALQGHGHLALISGEPGIGKTRLAHEAMVAAQLNGAVVLRGGCYEYEAATPYLPFVEALREWVHGQSAEGLRAQLGSTASELAKLAPEIESKLGALAANPALSPNEERLRLFDNVARFLQTLAAGRGLLLFIDDLHWADQGTLSLLHYLLRHLRNDRALILGAYREVELDRAHPLAAALVEWNRERLATRIPLGRLSLDETGALLATLFGQASVSQELTQAMHRETEGNPFFLEEVVKSLIEQGQIYREQDRWERKEIGELAIPQSVKEAIGRRLNRLSASCTDALHLAAALGKAFAFRELAAVATADEDQLLNALDEAIAAQLVRADSGDAFAFTHDKIREVLYEELNPIRRRRLHQRIGEGLENLYAADADGHVQDLAHHFTESGDLPKGLRYSLLAAEKTRRLFAPDDALHYYDHARESAEALNLPEQLAAIYEAMGEVNSDRGQHPTAVDCYQRALALASTSEQRAALKARIGTAYGQVGDERSLEFLHAALNELNPQSQANELALATATVGRHHHYHLQHVRAIEFLERARQLAEPLDDAFTLMIVYSYLAGAYQHMTRYDESMAWARQCIAMGERKNYPAAVAAGYEFLAEDSFGLGQWRDTLEFADRDRAIGERIGSQDRVAWAEFSRAQGGYGLGDLAAAMAVARTALAMAESIGDPRLAVISGSILSVVESDLGQDDAAREHAETALVRADELGQVFMRSIARDAVAYWHMQHAEWARAVALYDQCLELVAGTEHRASLLLIGAQHAEACWGAGRFEQAARIIADHLAVTRDARARPREAAALRVQGQILAAQNLWDDAARAFEAAIAILEESNSRLELGRALYRRGMMWQARGDVEAARSDGGRARALFAECGATRDLGRVAQALG